MNESDVLGCIPRQNNSLPFAIAGLVIIGFGLLVVKSSLRREKTISKALGIIAGIYIAIVGLPYFVTSLVPRSEGRPVPPNLLTYASTSSMGVTSGGVASGLEPGFAVPYYGCTNISSTSREIVPFFYRKSEQITARASYEWLYRDQLLASATATYNGGYNHVVLKPKVFPLPLGEHIIRISLLDTTHLIEMKFMVVETR